MTRNYPSLEIPDIAAKSGIIRLKIPILNGSKCANEHYSGSFWQPDKRFANETNLTVTVTHLPPGTSKWNKIEHRLFAFITQNWRGKPLVSHEVIVQLISATKTETGLEVCCEIDGSLYPKGVQVSEAQMEAITLTRAEFHGEWNYAIASNQQPP